MSTSSKVFFACLLALLLIGALVDPTESRSRMKQRGSGCLSNDGIASKSCGAANQCGKRCDSNVCELTIGNDFSAANCRRFCCDH
ncbi:hypothetical protein BV898_02871 [Hypsibius exemplaris]|uniref:Uncharacterized protein n=1 Tax=Hypsibius exemplaris TaxID=2072580 RepID=A0A1W0X6K0_HYPEX|nr:hypothetical protein BV898_02871 [Hypsibius exemplaris]